MSDESRARNAQLIGSLLGGGSGPAPGNSGADTFGDSSFGSSFLGGDWDVSTKAPKAPGIRAYVPLIVAVAGLVALAWIVRRGRP